MITKLYKYWMVIEIYFSFSQIQFPQSFEYLRNSWSYESFVTDLRAPEMPSPRKLLRRNNKKDGKKNIEIRETKLIYKMSRFPYNETFRTVPVANTNVIDFCIWHLDNFAAIVHTRRLFRSMFQIRSFKPTWIRFLYFSRKIIDWKISKKLISSFYEWFATLRRRLSGFRFRKLLANIWISSRLDSRSITIGSVDKQSDKNWNCKDINRSIPDISNE